MFRSYAPGAANAQKRGHNLERQVRAREGHPCGAGKAQCEGRSAQSTARDELTDRAIARHHWTASGDIDSMPTNRRFRKTQSRGAVTESQWAYLLDDREKSRELDQWEEFM